MNGPEPRRFFSILTPKTPVQTSSMTFSRQSLPSFEPYRVKTVEPICVSTPDQRRRWLKEAEHNLFRIPAERVMIDLLTDSGTGALSAEQWAAMMRGNESYAGSTSYQRLVDSVQKITGIGNVLPTQQGRVSERILVEAIIGKPEPTRGRGRGRRRGMIVPNNAHFDTTRFMIEQNGAEAFNLLCEGGDNPADLSPFKGDIDLRKLEQLLNQRGKDVLSNTGGLLLIRDADLFRRACNLSVLTEGFGMSYGGLAARDLECMAVGLQEVIDERYLAQRIATIAQLGQRLMDGGVAIVRPVGGHAVFIDAEEFCPHIARGNSPAHSLACALYEHAGVRAIRIGSVLCDRKINEPMELVRLAIPRRTYMPSHLDY